MRGGGPGPRPRPGCNDNEAAIWSPTLSRKIQLDKSIHPPTSSDRRPSVRRPSVHPVPFRFLLLPFYADFDLDCVCSYIRASVAAVRLSAGHPSAPSARARSPTLALPVRPSVRKTSKQRHRCLRRFSRQAGAPPRLPPGLPPSFRIKPDRRGIQYNLAIKNQF